MTRRRAWRPWEVMSVSVITTLLRLVFRILWDGFWQDSAGGMSVYSVGMRVWLRLQYLQAAGRTSVWWIFQYCTYLYSRPFSMRELWTLPPTIWWSSWTTLRASPSSAQSDKLFSHYQQKIFISLTTHFSCSVFNQIFFYLNTNVQKNRFRRIFNKEVLSLA